MSTERDELALELFIGDNANQPRESSIQDWKWYEDTGKFKGQVEHYKAMAAHALAAGYRKPQQITSVEELDALPLGSVVLDDYGVACQVESEWVTEAGPNRMWMTTGCDANTTVALPATVLHVGGAE